MHQSTNQSINQSINQPINQSIYPRRSPSHYNLFGLPNITINQSLNQSINQPIQIKPHVYLLVGFLVFLVGPKILIPVLTLFFFYRWHLNRESEQKENDRLNKKFAVFKSVKTRPKTPHTVIHSLNDSSIKE